MTCWEKFKMEYPETDKKIPEICPGDYGYSKRQGGDECLYDEDPDLAERLHNENPDLVADCEYIHCWYCWNEQCLKWSAKELYDAADHLDTENCIVAPSDTGPSIWAKQDDGKWIVIGGSPEELVRYHDEHYPIERSWELILEEIYKSEKMR